jgi:hypothetical protein
MKFQVLDDNRIQFFNSNGQITGELFVSESADMFLRPLSASGDLILGNDEVAGSVEIGNPNIQSTLKLMGGGTISSNGNTLTIGDISSGDNVILNSNQFSGSFSGSFHGDGSALTNIKDSVVWVQTTQSANFTAELNKGYLVNSSGSADGIIVTLPEYPSFGDQVAVLDVGGVAATDDVIMSSSININGQLGGQKLIQNNQSVYLLYTDDSIGWKPIKGINGGTSALATSLTVTFDFLVVAGGGSGGSVNGTYYGGGGGAGGLRTSYGSTSGGEANPESQIEVDTNVSITVTVGAGGAAISGTVNVVGNNGSNSSIAGTSINEAPFEIISTGGGGGGANTSNANSGGSGGGGSESNGVGGSGTSGQGFGGGTGSEGLNRGGGGGGAAGVGGATDGGDGLAVSITGASVTYAGGGASSGTGGAGGGGNAGTAGASNTGGGGGGISTNPVAGGSGIVILRYPAGKTLVVGSGLGSNTSTDGNFKVTSFTSGTGTVYFT